MLSILFRLIRIGLNIINFVNVSYYKSFKVYYVFIEMKRIVKSFLGITIKIIFKISGPFGANLSLFRNVYFLIFSHFGKLI